MKKITDRTPEEYLDGREFLPDEMERRVKEMLVIKNGSLPKTFSEKELKLKWRALAADRQSRRLKVWRAALTAACVILTITAAAVVFRPVKSYGGNTYITFRTESGGQEQFRYQYKDLDLIYGRTHRYKSWEEMEKQLGFKLLKPMGQELDWMHLEVPPQSDFYSVYASFTETYGAAPITGYHVYFVRNRSSAYTYTYQISREWEKLGEKQIGGRQIALYRTDYGNGRGYGAAFSEDGALYLLSNENGASLEEFCDALAKLDQ